MLDLKHAAPPPSLGGKRRPFSAMLDLGGGGGAGAAAGGSVFGAAAADGTDRNSSLNSLNSDLLLVFPHGRSEQDLGGGRLLSSYPPAAAGSAGAKRLALGGGGDSFQSRLHRSSGKESAAPSSPRMMALAEAGEGLMSVGGRSGWGRSWGGRVLAEAGEEGGRCQGGCSWGGGDFTGEGAAGAPNNVQLAIVSASLL